MKSKLVVLLLISSALAASAHPRPQDDSAIFFPGAVVQDHQDEEALVVEPSQGKLKVAESQEEENDLGDDPDCSLFNNHVQQVDLKTGEVLGCYEITSQGPCQDGEWYVVAENLDAEGHAIGVCRPRKCEEKRQVFYDGECREPELFFDCPSGMELLNNPFGEGACDCMIDFLPYTNETSGETVCYQEFMRGPCDPGQQFVETEEEDQDDFEGECVPTFCEFENEVRLENGVCVEAIDCGPRAAAILEEETGELFCSNIANRQLIIIPEECPPGQSYNHAGECKEEVTFGRGGNKRSRRRLASGSTSIQAYLKQRFQG